MLRRLTLLALMACTGAGATPLFDDDSVVEVTLTGPFKALFADTESREKLPFQLLAEGVDHQIAVRLRGRSRLRVCEFMPMRLDFRSSQTDGTLFEGQDKLKLVTHCRNHDRGEQDMLEEYAAYRIFNAISDKSYRVRLLRFNYQDPNSALVKKATPRYGFVIESRSELADRIGAEAVDLQGVPKQRFNREHAALVFIFEYLIGNTDWGPVKAPYDDGCCHNGDLFDIESTVYYVPYDFDLAGLVNTRYAYPDPLLPIDRVTQRLYRGMCVDADVLQSALQQIRAREALILQVMRETPGLSADSVKTGTRFLKSFFDKAENEEKLLRLFARRCL